jgi:integrase
MASVTRDPRSPRFWIACYTGRDGRQLKRSTKTNDKRKALQIAVELEDVESKVRQTSLTTTQLQKILSDVSEKVNGEGLQAPTAQDYLGDWLKNVSVRNTPATHERYQITVRLFLASLGPKAKAPVTAVTPKQVEEFVTSRLQAHMAPKTVIVDLKTLNTAFRRAEAYGVILKNPVAAVQPPKEQSSERDVFTHDEVEKLLNAAPDQDWQTLILLGYFVGARLSDAVHMKWENVHPKEGVLIYEQKKTGKKVVVPLTYHVYDHLTYLSQFSTSGFLCPSLAAKTPGGKHGLSESFKRIVIKAGIDPMVVDGKGIRKFTRKTFHSLRHSFNSLLANAGVTEEVRMKLTGHSSKAVHKGYTHFEMDTLKKAMGSFPMFGSNEKPPNEPQD